MASCIIEFRKLQRDRNFRSDAHLMVGKDYLILFIGHSYMKTRPADGQTAPPTFQRLFRISLEDRFDEEVCNWICRGVSFTSGSSIVVIGLQCGSIIAGPARILRRIPVHCTQFSTYARIYLDSSHFLIIQTSSIRFSAS